MSISITPLNLKIGWETQCCMAGRRFKENSAAFIHPQASTRVPDGDKAAQLPDQQMCNNNYKYPCVREDHFCQEMCQSVGCINRPVVPVMSETDDSQS